MRGFNENTSFLLCFSSVCSYSVLRKSRTMSSTLEVARACRRSCESVVLLSPATFVRFTVSREYTNLSGVNHPLQSRYWRTSFPS